MSFRWFLALESGVSETVEHESERLGSLYEAAQVWFELIEFFPHRGLSNFPEPALECAIDCLESLSLATHAYYKTAVSVLRGQVELALASCLFQGCPHENSKYCPTHRTQYEQSKHSPGWRDLRQVFGAAEFRSYARVMHTRKLEALAHAGEESSVHDFYWTISKAVHGVPGAWNLLDRDFNPLPRYSPTAFDAWADLFEVVQSGAILWLLLAHPGMFAWLDAASPINWSWVIDPAQLAYLRQFHST